VGGAYRLAYHIKIFVQNLSLNFINLINNGYKLHLILPLLSPSYTMINKKFPHPPPPSSCPIHSHIIVVAREKKEQTKTFSSNLSFLNYNLFPMLKAMKKKTAADPM
jgi:hypothetical protein